MPATETVVQRLARLKSERAAAKDAAKVAAEAAKAAAKQADALAAIAKATRAPHVPASQFLYDVPDRNWRPLSGDAKAELDAAVERMKERMASQPAIFKASLTGQDYRQLRWFCLTHKLPIPRGNKTGGKPKEVFIRAIKDYVDTFELERETAPAESLPAPVKRARAAADKRAQAAEQAAEALAAEDAALAAEAAEPEAVGADAWTLFQELVGEVAAGNDSPVLKLRIRKLVAEVIRDGLLTREELPALQRELGLDFKLG